MELSLVGHVGHEAGLGGAAFDLLKIGDVALPLLSARRIVPRTGRRALQVLVAQHPAELTLTFGHIQMRRGKRGACNSHCAAALVVVLREHKRGQEELRGRRLLGRLRGRGRTAFDEIRPPKPRHVPRVTQHTTYPSHWPLWV